MTDKMCEFGSCHNGSSYILQSIVIYEIIIVAKTDIHNAIDKQIKVDILGLL